MIYIEKNITTVPLQFAADATTTLRVGPLTLNNEFHHPAMIARSVATLDRLTGGRAVLGLGTPPDVEPQQPERRHQAQPIAPDGSTAPQARHCRKHCQEEQHRHRARQGTTRAHGSEQNGESHSQQDDPGAEIARREVGRPVVDGLGRDHALSGYRVTGNPC